ncbi:hypothetical protein DY037_05300 [Apilactobacillus micheneri]|uniref:hypothetical protein n=1 Tax=Apilactobacillus micheneri TaxID=1899430 RepID=UPI001129DC85|nr:hypothetical protein [Apilactobacillus micheneri]TPR49196.1 hypothetical protein DY037_05300 [Apilactobacillus micheneri]
METIEKQIKQAIKYQNISYIKLDRTNILKVKQANYVLNTIRVNSIYNEQLPMIFKLKVFINGLVYKQDVEKTLSAIHLFNNKY